MSRPAGEARRRITQALRSGVTGTYEAIAAVAGVEPVRAQQILKEIRRAGHSRSLFRTRMEGRPGAHRSVHAAPSTEDAALDPLAHCRQAWR